MCNFRVLPFIFVILFFIVGCTQDNLNLDKKAVHKGRFNVDINQGCISHKISFFFLSFFNFSKESSFFRNFQISASSDCIGGPFDEVFHFPEVELLSNFKNYIFDRSRNSEQYDELVALVDFLGLKMNKRADAYLDSNPPPLRGEKLLNFLGLILDKEAWEFEQILKNKDKIIKSRILGNLLRREKTNPSSYGYEIMDIYQEVDHYYPAEVVSFNKRSEFSNYFKGQITWSKKVLDAFDDFTMIYGVPDVDPVDTTDTILQALTKDTSKGREVINEYISILRSDFQLEQQSNHRIVDLEDVEREIPYLHDRYIIRKKWKDLTGKKILLRSDELMLDAIWKLHGVDNAINVLENLSKAYSTINLDSLADSKLGKELSITSNELKLKEIGLTSNYYHDNILKRYVDTLKKNGVKRESVNDKNAIPISPGFIFSSAIGVATGKFIDKTQRDFESAISRGDVKEADRLFRLNSAVSLLEAGTDVAGDLVDGATVVASTGNPMVATLGIIAGAGYTIYKAGEVIVQVVKNKNKLNKLKNPPSDRRSGNYSDSDIDDAVDIVIGDDEDDFWDDDLLDIIFA